MEWLSQGTWGDSVMPDVSMVGIGFYAYFTSDPIPLDMIREYFGDSISKAQVFIQGEVFQEGNDFFILTSSNEGETWETLSEEMLIQSGLDTDELLLRVYIYSTCQDLLPFEGSRVDRVFIIFLHQLVDRWIVEVKPDGDWEVIKGQFYVQELNVD